MGQSIRLKDGNYWDASSIRTVQNVLVAGTNCDSYIYNGCYYFDSERTPINAPAGVTNGWLQVISEQPLNEGRGSGYVKQIWYRAGTPNSNDFQTFIRTANIGITGWSAWRRLIVEDDIYYSVGEQYWNYSIIYCGGHITGGNTSICTNISVPKRMDRINSITVNGYDITVRSTAGSYIINRLATGSNLSISCVKADPTNVQITINSPTALSATNNSPVAVAIYALTLTFN